jgi:hypothetical protein
MISYETYNTIQKNNYSIYFNNVVATPAYLNPSILPNDILHRAKKLNNIQNINYSQNKNLEYLLPTFVNFTKDLDNLRNTNILDVCPELSSLFE